MVASWVRGECFDVKEWGGGAQGPPNRGGTGELALWVQAHTLLLPQRKGTSPQGWPLPKVQDRAKGQEIHGHHPLGAPYAPKFCGMKVGLKNGLLGIFRINFRIGILKCVRVVMSVSGIVALFGKLV